MLKFQPNRSTFYKICWKLWYFFCFTIFFQRIIIISRSILRTKFYFKKIVPFGWNFGIFYQIPYLKNVKVWNKFDNFLINKIFIRVLILFLCTTRTTPYNIKFPFYAASTACVSTEIGGSLLKIQHAWSPIPKR